MALPAGFGLPGTIAGLRVTPGGAVSRQPRHISNVPVHAAGREADDSGVSSALNPTNLSFIIHGNRHEYSHCRNDGHQSGPLQRLRFAWNRGAIRLAGILRDTEVMARQFSALGASAGRGPGSRAPSRGASRPSGFDPSRDHESLAGGTRLRVPPSFHSGVVITAPLRVPC